MQNVLGLGDVLDFLYESKAGGLNFLIDLAILGWAVDDVEVNFP
jgi:hypothetical protein